MTAILNTVLEMPLGSQITAIIVIGYLIVKGIIKIPTFGSKNNNNVHAKCGNFDSVINLINNAVSIYQKTIRIKYIDTLYEQMTLLEVTHEDITLKMLSDFRELTSNIKDIRTYRSLIKEMEHELKNLFRKWFKENHFTKRTDQEFIHYIKDKLQLVQKVITAKLDDEFVDYSITRKELRDDNMTNLVPYIQDKYTKLFYEVRDISSVKEKEVEELNKSLTSIKNGETKES